MEHAAFWAHLHHHSSLRSSPWTFLETSLAISRGTSLASSCGHPPHRGAAPGHPPAADLRHGPAGHHPDAGHHPGADRPGVRRHDPGRHGGPGHHGGHGHRGGCGHRDRPGHGHGRRARGPCGRHGHGRGHDHHGHDDDHHVGNHLHHDGDLLCDHPVNGRGYQFYHGVIIHHRDLDQNRSCH